MRWWERVIPAVVTALVFGAGYGWAGDISYPGGPSGSLLSGTVVDGDDVELSFRTHATDCTSLTDGVAGEPCLNLDDHDVFVCEPTAGACDSATEWVQKTTRKHATDCTSLTDGKAGQLCQNTDDNKLFVCNPTAGDCSGSEWKEYLLSADALDSSLVFRNDDDAQVPFQQQWRFSGNAQTGGVSSGTIDDDCMLVREAGSTPAACWGGTTTNYLSIYKPTGRAGTVLRMVCILETSTGEDASDAIQIEIIEGTPGGAITTLSNGITFTNGGSPSMANSTFSALTVETAMSLSSNGIQLRMQLTDANASISTIEFVCTVWGSI